MNHFLGTSDDLANFYEQRKAGRNKRVLIQVVSEVTFEPLQRYIPFYMQRFNLDADFKIGNYDQLANYVHQSQYNEKEKPDYLYIHNSTLKLFIKALTTPSDDATEQFSILVGEYLDLIEAVVESPERASVIVNLFELPPFKVRGTFSAKRGEIKVVNDANRRLIELSAAHPDLILHDCNFVSSHIGLANWYDFDSWAAFKQPLSGTAIKHFSSSFASVVASVEGGAKKLLVSDLDNTLWGGIIGDDGVEGIKLGCDTPKGELFSLVQGYLKSLRAKGILLALSSKNEEAIALEGLAKSAALLSAGDFSAKQINWTEKSSNIEKIISDLNLLPESAVFMDDNVFELEEVSNALKEITICGYEKSPLEFVNTMEFLGLFETQNISIEDDRRANMYAHNVERKMLEQSARNHDDFLNKLRMSSNIFVNFTKDNSRFLSLNNKTNQFNTAQKKISFSDIDEYSKDPNKIILSADLSDKFGYNGVVCCLFGKFEDSFLFIENWVISCRVFNRGLESLILDILFKLAVDSGVNSLCFAFNKTKKNGYCQSFFSNSFLVERVCDSHVRFCLEDVRRYSSEIGCGNGYGISFEVHRADHSRD